MRTLIILIVGLVMTMVTLHAEENYTLIERKKLLASKPSIDGRNIKVWTIQQNESIRINFVEMSGELPLHKHPDAAHSLMVLSGRIKVQIGKQFKIINEGDYISIPAGVPHKYWPQTETATLISMDAPYYDTSKTVSLE